MRNTHTKKNYAPAKTLSALLEKMNHANSTTTFPVLPPKPFLIDPPLEPLGAEWKVAGSNARLQNKKKIKIFSQYIR